MLSCKAGCWIHCRQKHQGRPSSSGHIMMRGSELISWLPKTSCFPILHSGPPPTPKQRHPLCPITNRNMPLTPFQSMAQENFRRLNTPRLYIRNSTLRQTLLSMKEDVFLLIRTVNGVLGSATQQWCSLASKHDWSTLQGRERRGAKELCHGEGRPLLRSAPPCSSYADTPCDKMKRRTHKSNLWSDVTLSKWHLSWVWKQNK